jgi:protocatechuate 3,4-dioxygenase beta subunit
MKFLDENGNSIKDSSEIGLENWIIKLSDGSETSTDINGNYTFTNLLAGVYTVRESLQTGWTQTFPSDTVYSIEIFSGTDTSDNDFGNFKNGSIGGMKFEDMNANGTLDSNDLPLANWNISYTNGEQTATVQTDENGNYSFTNLGPGTYIITEEIVNGYYQSLPVEDSTYTIFLSSGDSVTMNNFGNYRFGSISGKKYLDENVNGTLDSNETGIENWLIKLSSGDSVFTDAQGNYSFANLIPNEYSVSEILPSTWTQSEPDEGTYTLEIISNLHIANKNFGNFQKGSVSGVVFNDKNRNAVKEVNEPGLENWEIQLSGNATDTTFSDSSGNYSFANLFPGNYVVKEILKPKHYQTSPAETIYTLTITSGENESDKNFGNFEDTTKYRTFKSTPLLAEKPVKMKFKNNILLTAQPTLATALYNVFARLGKTGSVALGVPQTDKLLAKQYGWILFKKASELAKFYTSEHTGQAFPIDSFRQTGKKSKKLSKALKPTRKKYDNIAWESGVLLNLNLAASEKNVLPPYFGQLVIDTPITLIGRNMQGQTLAATGRYFDSLMTYWKENDVDSSNDYLSIALFVDLVLKRIHNGFYDAVIASNYQIDTTGVKSADTNSTGKANAYAVTLKGIKSASEVGVVKYVPGKMDEAYFSSIKNFSEPNEFTLHQNYPNPFNPATTIEFSLPEDAQGTLQVFNILGQKIAEVFRNKFWEEGEHHLVFDANNIPSGVYFYRFDATGESGAYHAVKKMIVLK